ncbi:ABC transporter ATP-binding protein [Conexibacter woesei]|uniref:Oligopeptide/dipeptide ABC transporter, ATPase subunit n=1 Tax=Conexibacter woesei (strain DSM 14684 / CCUG 47730 / CIP 108061 / JCM 11494 / NBRC 100937 / ID131577) TaxID=469383 RepID=D3F5J7_CONWI|nr:ABC transporter ATP-binding protein [Conexibacter woesei]ADB50664.1 oligopeptide/dipeptide ABC transporter, ATPase subunit [Conexibacter woesei DSM 14684]
MSGPLLELDDLAVVLPVEGRPQTVLHGVSLAIGAGEAVGLVGESGSGKSMTARAVARLLPRGATVSGGIRFDGRDVLGLRGAGLRDYRAEVSVVFQDPRTHVNPVRRIGDFMTEALCTNGHVRPAEARRRAIARLEEVGIDDGERRLRQYPHQLSGGLLQRVMIATALLTEPRLLLADEPTTALDVTTQAEVMAILDELRRERGLSLLFITHDLELASAVCDRTAVMYAGQLMETRPSARLHDAPLHPYTAALTAARPSVEQATARLTAIPGRPLSAFEAPPGCPFAPRCPHAEERCRAARPPLRELDDGAVRCVRAQELHGRLLVTHA